MEPLEPRLILVPTDRSEPAAHALRYASALGERFGARLLVVYADPFIPPTDFRATTAGVFELSRDAMMAAARKELLAHVEENVRSRVPFDARVIVGEPLESIMAQLHASHADLVVMGTHGRAGVNRLMYGSVTEAAMRVVPVPVIAVNPATTETAEMENILCPITFTPACRAALQYAAALGGHRARPVLLLRTADRIGIDELNRLHEWLPPELIHRCHLERVSSDDEAEQVVETAKQLHAHLIAFGVAADRPVTYSVLGTIAERVVQRSGCAVLTVNAHAAKATFEKESR